jgi:membrane associated rhomboid family serine protease
MVLLGTRDSWWMAQCEAALLAEGVPLRWLAAASGASFLDVPASETMRAVVVLSSLHGEELSRRAERGRRRSPTGPLLLQPAFATAIGLAALTLAFFWVTGPSASHSLWFERGAFLTRLAGSGEWWRFVTAATLHADNSHAVGNAGFFVVLGWAAAERLGGGVTTLAWLFTAAAGFVATVLFSDAAVTVGASGGLFGLLGAAAAHAVRHRRATQSRRRDRLRVLGGSVMLLAFTAFSPRANIAAHVGGFVAGLAFGAALPSVFSRRGVQVLAGAATAAIVATAWLVA